MKRIIRILCYILCVACLLLNIGPVLVRFQANIGVFVGIGFSIVFFIYGLKFDSINQLISKIWSKTRGKVVLSIVSFVVAIVLVLGCITLGRVISYSYESDTTTDYVIVLGCQVNGTKPGIFLERRLGRALQYLEENKNSKAILSGGKGTNEDISEAQCMYNYLVEHGIGKGRLYMEDKSTSTDENFRFSIELLKKQGIEPKEITVVTNDFHEYRASLFAERNGLKAYSCPVPTSIASYLPFAVREVFAVTYQIYLK